MAYGSSWNFPKFQQFVLNMNNNHGAIKSTGLQIAPIAKFSGTKSYHISLHFMDCVALSWQARDNVTAHMGLVINILLILK